MLVHGLIAYTLVALGASVSQKGNEVHCISNRAHLLQYDVEGEENDGSSLTNVRQAIVSMTPSPDHAHHCSHAKVQLGDHTPEGNKTFCYGANQDDSCKAAKSVIPMKDGFDCKDCFLSAKADAIYKLNYSMKGLHSVEVGLKDIHLRAAVEVHKHMSSSRPVSGSMPFPGSNHSITLIDTLIGCPVCLRIYIVVAFPTSLEYTFDKLGDVDFEAGAAMDINLGNNIVKYFESTGWSHDVDKAQVSVTPLISVDAKASADMKLGVKTSLQVNVDDIIWYHLNMAPTIDAQVTFAGKNLLHNDRVCVNGDAGLDMTQEADLNWNFIVWHAKDHWGPKDLYTWSKTGAVSGCKDIKLVNTTDVIV